MKLKMFLAAAAMAAAGAAAAAPLSLDYTAGTVYQQSTRWEVGYIDRNVAGIAMAGNNLTSQMYTRFYFKLQLPPYTPGFALTSAILAITYDKITYGDAHPLQLFGTDADYQFINFYKSPKITTGELAILPDATAHHQVAYLDLTSYLSHFAPGDFVSFVFKSRYEGTNWGDGAQFYGQTLKLNYQDPASPSDPGQPGQVPEPQSLVLLALGLAAMWLGLRRRRAG